METGFAVVLTTVSGQQEASSLALKLVQQKLAACVQMLPINSVYSWEGVIQQDPEVLLLVKTHASRFAEIESFIRANHSYSVPEIIQLSIEQGSAGYLRWLESLVLVNGQSGQTV